MKVGFGIGDHLYDSWFWYRRTVTLKNCFWGALSCMVTYITKTLSQIYTALFGLISPLGSLFLLWPSKILIFSTRVYMRLWTRKCKPLRRGNWHWPLLETGILERSNCFLNVWRGRRGSEAKIYFTELIRSSFQTRSGVGTSSLPNRTSWFISGQLKSPVKSQLTCSEFLKIVAWKFSHNSFVNSVVSLNSIITIIMCAC